MIRYIKYAFLAVVAICLVLLSVANQTPVELKAFPEMVSNVLGLAPTITMPLFLVIMIGVGLGLFIGFVWEWLREFRIRSEAARQRREAEALKAEVNRLKGEKHEGKDEVLALLEQTS